MDIEDYLYLFCIPPLCYFKKDIKLKVIANIIYLMEGGLNEKK